jgi:3-dehydroshikimate dehydratase
MEYILHSYTFRDYSLKEAFANAQRFGWQGIELQPCHFDEEAVETEVAAAVALGKEYGIPIRCLDYSGDFSNDDAGAAEKSVAWVERAIDVCATQNIPMLNGFAGWLTVDDNDWGKNGSALAQDIHYERAAEALRHLGAKADEQGIRIVLEIHMNTIHDTVAGMARLLDLVGRDNVLANPDPGNMFAVSTAEKDPDALDALQGRLGYFHLKNCCERQGAYDYSTLLAHGHIDLSRWLEKLLAMDYDGPICTEYCGAGDPRVAAEADMAYVKKSLRWLRSQIPK